MSISTASLLSAVENTAPFVFAHEQEKYVQLLKNAQLTPIPETELLSYYALCLAAHFATVGTFVPTDVDNAIRQKLWSKVHHEEVLKNLWDLLLEFLTWDETFVSRRWVKSPSGKKISGHQGEWFSVALGAYATARKLRSPLLGEIREKIEAEHQHQVVVLTELRQEFLQAPARQSMKDLLSGVASLAHNLGDLDRMIDAWHLPDEDVLKRRLFRSGHEDARQPAPLLLQAGAFYQKYLASENHRHFALRGPKCLRRSSATLLPYGPFLDDWGKSLPFAEGELREVVQALIEGWKRLNPKSIYTSLGYARALAGIQQALPHGRSDLEALLPPLFAKEISSGGLRTHLGTSQASFEEAWVKRLRAEWVNQ